MTQYDLWAAECVAADLRWREWLLWNTSWWKYW